MEMAAGGAVSQTTVADVANRVTLEHVVADGNGVTFVVRIARFGAVWMFDHHKAAVALVPFVG